MGRESKRWDDPDSDEGDEPEKGDQEWMHPQTDRGGLGGGDEESASEEDMKGSDSEGEGGDDPFAAFGGLEALTKDRAAVPGKGKGKRPSQDDDALWDPLAGVGPRRKRKAAPTITTTPGAGATKSASSTAPVSSETSAGGLPVGATVILIDLQKAPQLNGKLGIVAGQKDGATGRCPVLLADSTVKSLRAENLRPVMSGAVVRLKELKSTPELNGRIAECGEFDLANGRYVVILADGKETQKRVKEENLEILNRYVSPIRLLAAQAENRPFTWAEALDRGSARERQAWPSQLELLVELGLPKPRFLPCAALAAGLTEADSDKAVTSDSLPLTADGRLACRVLAVSPERDSCCPAGVPKPEEIRRLAAVAASLQQNGGAEMPVYFLHPGFCTKALPCLRGAASCAWPLYIQICQGVLCVQTEHHAHKAWCRFDQLLAGHKLSKPVYLLGAQKVSTSKSGVATGENSGWLLSDKSEELMIGAPLDGQVLPADRRLLDRLCTELLEESVRKGKRLTCYRL